MFLVLVSDGVHGAMSNQEIVDIVKQCTDPTSAAIAIVDLAERYGAHDNCTAMVVRLDGWEMGEMPLATRDYTRNLRRYKLKHSSMSGRSGVDLGVSNFFDDDDVDDDDDTATGEETPKEAEQEHWRELRADRFIVDLFDQCGKDIGSTDSFGQSSVGFSWDERLNRYTARVDPSSMVKQLGRITPQEVRDALVEMDIGFRQQTTQKVEIEQDEVIEKLFEGVDGHSAQELLVKMQQLGIRIYIKLRF
jgi:hypothetical protein